MQDMHTIILVTAGKILYAYRKKILVSAGKICIEKYWLPQVRSA
jgi:hypothetical protein